MGAAGSVAPPALVGEAVVCADPRAGGVLPAGTRPRPRLVPGPPGPFPASACGEAPLAGRGSPRLFRRPVRAPVLRRPHGGLSAPGDHPVRAIRPRRSPSTVAVRAVPARRGGPVRPERTGAARAGARLRVRQGRGAVQVQGGSGVPDPRRLTV
ncbi:hypothetical protein SCWH03_06640 [Streptomyces pacificus]|uniref:Uncharacterized protein n=1 Tax=Streptomyces pacificus TaxID=2705029 RepID=A0A6A0AN97_9ACTN|nr:hypothetical protein SCWH03_06640 [Streptomyces pacificus]